MLAGFLLMFDTNVKFTSNFTSRSIGVYVKFLKKQHRVNRRFSVLYSSATMYILDI